MATALCGGPDPPSLGHERAGVRHRHAHGRRGGLSQNPGQPRPWVNETLTRLIYLDGKPPELQPDEGVISPNAPAAAHDRQPPRNVARAVETAAASSRGADGCALRFAPGLGRDTPADAAALDKLLNTEAQRLKALLASSRRRLNPGCGAGEAVGSGGPGAGGWRARCACCFCRRRRRGIWRFRSRSTRSRAATQGARLEGGEVLANAAAHSNSGRFSGRGRELRAGLR